MNVSVLPPFVPARTCFIVRNGKTDHLRIGRENQTETGLIVPMLNWLSLISSTSFNRRSQLTTCFRTAGWHSETQVRVGSATYRSGFDHQFDRNPSYNNPDGF
jgi:hypothetical protein